MDVGQLKGSVVINFGSVREAEKAIKALQGTFNKVAGDSKKLIKAADDLAKSQNAQAQAAKELAKSNTQLAATSNRVDAAEKARIKAHAAAEKNLVALSRAERDNLNVTKDTQSALSAARRATEEYRNTVDKLGAGSVEATRAQVRMKAAVDDAKNAVRDSNNNTKNQISAYKQLVPAITQSDKATKSSVVSIDRRQKALTQAAAAEKQIMVLKRQSAAETTRGNIALNNARQALAIYRDGLSDTSISITNLNKRYEILQRALTRASVSTTGLNSATANTRSWFRSSRAAASQFGLQLQDVAVQAQMGTNALVILGQQGSQLLGFFGAGGAMAGAVLAIGAAFAYVMSSAGQAEQATKLLDESLSTLNDTIDETDDGVRVLSDEILRYAKISETAARIELEKRLLDVGIAVREATTLIGSESSKFVSNFTTMAKKIDDFRNGALRGTDTLSGFSSEIVRFTSTLNSAAKELGINRGQLESLMQAYNSVSDSPTEENFLSLIDTLSAIKMEAGDTTDNFTKLAGALNNAAVQAIEAIRNGEDIEQALKNLSKALDVSTEATNRSGKATKTAADEAAEYIARLKEEAETVSLSEQALVRYRIEKLAGKDATIQNAQALIEEGQAYVATVQAAEDRIKQMEEEEQRREQLLDQMQKDYQTRQQFMQGGETSQVMTQAIQLKSAGVDEAAIKDFMARQNKIINESAREVSSSPFGDIETLDLELAQREQRLIEYFGREKAMTTEHWKALQENAEQVKPLLQVADWAQTTGKALGYMGNIMSQATTALETMGRKGSKEWKAFAMAQATVNYAMAVMNAWVMATEAGKMAGPAGPAVTAAVGGTMTALLSATFGAQIAQIQSSNYATGGLVRGPGTGTSDDIPANLSNGEYVLRADAVRKIGVANLNAMNQGRIANFSSGGMVGSGSAGGGMGTTVVVNDNRSGGAPVQTRETTDQYGNSRIELLIEDVVRNGMSRGTFDREMRGNYGIQRPGRRV